MVSGQMRFGTAETEVPTSLIDGHWNELRWLCGRGYNIGRSI
jgi:hypothetical protein